MVLFTIASMFIHYCRQLVDLAKPDFMTEAKSFY